MTKLNLNKAAIEQLNGNTKVRARVNNGALQLRPTHRVSGKRLPAGEKLIDVKRMGFFSQIDLQAAFGEDGPDVPTKGALAQAKHGWLTLVMVDDADTALVPTVKAV